jgi:hypothetical protein
MQFLHRLLVLALITPLCAALEPLPLGNGPENNLWRAIKPDSLLNEIQKGCSRQPPTKRDIVLANPTATLSVPGDNGGDGGPSRSCCDTDQIIALSVGIPSALGMSGLVLWLLDRRRRRRRGRARRGPKEIKRGNAAGQAPTVQAGGSSAGQSAGSTPAGRGYGMNGNTSGGQGIVGLQELTTGGQQHGRDRSHHTGHGAAEMPYNPRVFRPVELGG